MLASAEIYKWVDEEGRVQYADKPTDKHKTHEVEIESGPSPDQIDKAREKAEELKRRSRDVYIADKLEKQERLAEKERQLVQERHCSEARKQLAILQELHLPVYLDVKGQFRAKWEYDTYQGERKYLNDAERASATQQARKNVVANCKHPDDENEQGIARQ